MAIYKEDIVDIELESGTIHRSWLMRAIGLGDAKGNRFGVRLLRNGEPVNVGSATVTGLFMAPNGTNYVINESQVSGSTWIDGNVAGVILPSGCYAVEGQFCLAIKLSQSGVVTTMRIIDGMVSNTGTTGAVVPSSNIPTGDQIIAAYQQAMAVIDNSVRYDVSQELTNAQKRQARLNVNAAGMALLAPVYSSSSTYAVGDHVHYDGYYYVCNTAITTAEEWTAAHWTQVTVGGEVNDLKSAFDDVLYGATYNFTGTPSATNKFNMPLFEGKKYTATNNTGAAITVILYKSDGTSKIITSQLLNGVSIEFTVDANDYTQIGGWFNSGSTGTLSVTCGFSIFDKLDDIESAVGDNAEAISDLTGTVGDMTKKQNIPRTDCVKKAGYFFNINNQDYAANQWDYYTLAVNAGEQYTIDTKAGQSARAWIFRNSSQEIISMDSYSDTPVQATYNVTVPANAVEMIMNSQPSGTFSIIQKNAETINEDKIIYKNKTLPNYLDDIDGKAGNILAGKILCCCGDSITYGADMPQDGIVTPTIESYQYSAYTKKWTRWTAEEPAAYGYQIAARNGMIFYNGGVSGACVQGSGGTSTVPGFSVADGEYTLLPDNIDYLTLFFGWNDTAFGSLGTINDATNDSYYGGYNVVLPYLINKYPYTKIAIIVPFGTDVGHRQAIRDLANKWGVACFDLYKEGAPLYYGKEPSINVDADIVTANRAKFQANGAHPNFQGHYLISTMLEAFLRGI